MVCFFSLLTPVCAAADSTNPMGEESSFAVRVSDNLLTVRVRGVPVETVLGEIAKQTQIKVFFHGAADRLISLDLSRVPLDEGLKREKVSGLDTFLLLYQTGKETVSRHNSNPLMVLPLTFLQKYFFIGLTLVQ